jgi:hypothetical protein
MFTILFWHNDHWVDFVTSGLETGLLSPQGAKSIREWTDIETVAANISYVADQVQVLPPSNKWKVIGPPGVVLPPYIGAAYEVRQ